MAKGTHQQDKYKSYIGELVQVQTIASENSQIIGILQTYEPSRWWKPNSGCLILEGYFKNELENGVFFNSSNINFSSLDYLFDLKSDIEKDKDNISVGYKESLQEHIISLDKIINVTLMYQ
ncbi:MAG: hypothetical protein AABW92_04175 [Nanoarchaeota archaeon]